MLGSSWLNCHFSLHHLYNNFSFSESLRVKVLTLDYFNLRLQNFKELLDILNMEKSQLQRSHREVTAFEAKVSNG